MSTRPLTLITGASGGIGADLARVFASHGQDLALVARDGARLQALAQEIAVPGRPAPLVIALDLTAPGALNHLIGHIEQANATVACLVNNAGFGAHGEFAAADLANNLGLMDLNMRVLVELTHMVLPQICDAKGQILNVASIASFAPGPGMAAYYASKAFVLSFSEALYQELKPQGVLVSVLCPGLTATGFQARAGFGPSFVPPKYATMDSMAVAQCGYAGLMAGKRRVIPGLANKILIKVLQLTPRLLALPIIAYLQRARR